MTLGSLLWFASALATTATNAHLAGNPKRVTYRRQGRGLARTMLRGYAPAFGVFTPIPPPTHPTE